MADQSHVAILGQGVRAWNRWRRQHPSISPDLSQIPVTGLIRRASQALGSARSSRPPVLNLSNANFFDSSLEAADLVGVNLRGANLYEADLSRADLTGADLTGSMMRKAYLAGTTLNGARLLHVNLNRATLVRTKLAGARIENCVVYGVSTWQVTTDRATVQRNLVIEDSVLAGTNLRDAIDGVLGYRPLMVDDIEIAQFIHFVTNYRNFGKTLHALLDKGVLLLGQFKGDGRRLLELVAERLRRLQLIPIVFDFESPRGSSLIETVTTLAGISKMVIANLNGKSVPAELERITSSYQKPLIACVRADREKAVYALFSDLLEKNNVLYLKYRTTDQLLEKLAKKIHEAESSFHRLQIQRHERVLRKLKEG